MSRQKLESMNFKENGMKEKLVGRRPLGRILLQTPRYEILHNDVPTIH